MDRPYCLGLYEKSMPQNLSIAEKLHCAREAGYDFLELSIDETDEKLARLDWTADMLREVRAAGALTGIPIRSICLSGHRRFPLGHPDPAVRGKGLAIMEKAIALAGKLGIRVIQIAGYDVYYEPSTPETRAHFGKGLRRSVDLAAKEGVMLAFETMETDFLNTVEKAMYWVETIHSPYLQVYPDTGNITNAAAASGGDVLADLATGRGHLAALHLKESRPGVFREVPYGEGHVDFRGLGRRALDMGVRQFLAEFWYSGEADWRETLERNQRFLRGALDSGGSPVVNRQN